MKKITLTNYRTDRYYPRILRAVETLLGRGDVVAPIEVFIEMNLLTRESLRDWRLGKLPYLERAIHCNLGEASRILRILRIHADNQNLRPSITIYHRHGKGPKTRLRFSKSGEPALEEAYSRHFIRGRSKKEVRDDNDHPPTPAVIQPGPEGEGR